MDFVRVVQVFVWIADAGSFNRAAEQLDTSNAATAPRVSSRSRRPEKPSASWRPSPDLPGTSRRMQQRFFSMRNRAF